MRVLHLADLHIRCAPADGDRHEEYSGVFARLCEQAARCKPDSCLIAGDVFHSKYKCSARGADLFRRLLRDLAGLCPVYVLAGNHDFQQQSASAPDLVTAIVGDGVENVTVMSRTGVYRCGDLSYSVVTVQDALEEGATSGHRLDLPEFPRDAGGGSKHRVAAFHGPVKSSRLCNGSDLMAGVPVSWFDGFDAVMLGDIHKPQVHRARMAESTRERIRWTWGPGDSPWGYSGSAVQQNHGEPLMRHGFMLWDLAAREVEHHHVRNDHGMVDAYYVDGEWKYEVEGEYVDRDAPWLPKKLAARAKSDVGTLERMSLAEDAKIEQVCQPVPDVDLAEYLRSSDKKDDEWDVVHDLSKIAFSPEELPDRIRSRIAALRKQVDACADLASSACKLERYQIESLEIRNVLCYREPLRVDFSELRGRIVGLVGPNSSGKSSFIEAICIALFGTGYRTADDIISRGQARATCEVTVSGLTVRREFGLKNGKARSTGASVTKGGVEVRKGKAAVDAYVKSAFGTMDMFLASSCVTQNNDFDFLAMPRDKKVGFLDRILGLEGIDATEACLKEVCLIQKNVADHLEAKLDGARREDPEPHLSALDMHRARIKTLAENERELRDECARLQCKPADLVDVEAALREVRGIRVSASEEVVRVSGKDVGAARPYDVCLAEYEAHASARPKALADLALGARPDPELPADPGWLESERRRLSAAAGRCDSEMRSALEELDGLCEAQPPRPVLSPEDRRRLEGDPPPKPDPAGPAPEGPHNPACWACNRRLGHHPDAVFAAWYHENIARAAAYDAHAAWRSRKDLAAAALRRNREDLAGALASIERVDRHLEFLLNKEHAEWAAREAELRDELFTAALRETAGRARRKFLLECVDHTRYASALAMLDRSRRDLARAEFEAESAAERHASALRANEEFARASDALHKARKRLASFQNLHEHYRGYKEHLYRTSIGPRICGTANGILRGVNPMTVAESGMVFTIDGLHVERAGGFQRSIASIAVRIALSTVCSQMFIDEGFANCDQENVRRVHPFLRRLMGAYSGILVCSHIQHIIDETDAKWTFPAERAAKA